MKCFVTGGKRKTKDKSAAKTAIREMTEETGGQLLLRLHIQIKLDILMRILLKHFIFGPQPFTIKKGSQDSKLKIHISLD